MGTYDQLPGLEHLYLEDSYLPGIHEHDNDLRFEVEAVLTEQHPRYVPRKAPVFSEPRSVTWIERTMRPIVGSDTESDYGNIDSFTWQDDRYEPVGGHVVTVGPPPSVKGAET